MGMVCYEPGLIRLLIRGNRLTQEEVARRTGLTEKHVSRLCSHDTGISERTAENLAEVLNVHPELLILAQYLERADRAAREQSTPEEDP